MLVEDTRSILVDELEKLRIRIANNIRDKGMTASGLTESSMHVEMSSEGALEKGVLYGRKAIRTLERGRKPGNVPKDFYEIIKQWVIDKGAWAFDTVASRNSFAYLVARKIAKDGTKLYREGGQSDVYSSEIPKTLEALQNRIMKSFIEKVSVKHITIN